MSINRRIENLEAAAQARDPINYPDIVIHLSWEPGEGKITVDGEEMTRGEISRRWPGWDEGPMEIKINWQEV